MFSIIRRMHQPNFIVSLSTAAQRKWGYLCVMSKIDQLKAQFVYTATAKASTKTYKMTI